MPPTILYVEDTPTDGELAIDAFIRAKVARQIVIAQSGEEALRYLESADPLPVLMLVDLGLPTMSGVVLIHTVRNTPRTAHIPIVILTGRDDDEKVLSALGADAYLTKPLDIGTLQEKLRRIGKAQLLTGDS